GAGAGGQRDLRPGLPGTTGGPAPVGRARSQRGPLGAAHVRGLSASCPARPGSGRGRSSLMRILHVLDHSIPLQSGYTFRTRAILEQQRSFGWETFHITGAKQGKGSGQAEEDVDGLHFYRSPPLEGLAARLPMYNQWAVVQ